MSSINGPFNPGSAVTTGSIQAPPSGSSIFDSGSLKTFFKVLTAKIENIARQLADPTVTNVTIEGTTVDKTTTGGLFYIQQKSQEIQNVYQVASSVKSVVDTLNKNASKMYSNI